MAKRNVKQPIKQQYQTYGSLAYAPEPIYEPMPNAPVEQEQRVSPAVKRAEKRRHRVHRMKLFLAVTAVFTGAIITTVSHAVVDQQRVSNDALREELSALESANLALQAEITEQVNLEYVEEQATTRLGMAEPQPYQIVYIDVPKESYTLQYSEEVPEKQTGFSLAAITNLFKRN